VEKPDLREQFDIERASGWLTCGKSATLRQSGCAQCNLHNHMLHKLQRPLSEFHRVTVIHLAV